MTAAVARVRRFDPDRKERILDAALAVVAQHGLAGTTVRRIASAADVPLGSLTYHFDGLEDLLEQAFRRHSARMAAAYADHFAGVRTRDDLVEAVTDFVHGDACMGRDDWAVSYDLYLAALREPRLRTVTEEWMQASRSVLRDTVDPVTARGLDALIEGLVMHKILSTAPVDRAETRLYVDRAIPAVPSEATRPTESRKKSR